MQGTNEALRGFTDSLLQSPYAVPVACLVGLVYGLVFCRIFARAGFAPALGLLVFVPPMTFILPFLLAFAPWPTQRELRSLRRIEKLVHRADERHRRIHAA